MSDASRYAWACGVFGLQPGASPQEVRAAVMSHLDDADFMPPAGWRQAIRLLCDPQSPQAGPQDGYDAFREALVDNLAEEVDEFAAQFFALPSGPRRAKWMQLLKQAAAFPRLDARLRSLQPGLEAGSATPAGEDQQDTILVNRIRRLFVLKPRAQDQQRRQWLAAMTGDWRSAVRRVRRNYPKLARLDADFLLALESSQHGAAAVKISPAFAAHTNLAAAFIAVPKTAAARPSPARTTAKSGSFWSSGSGLWVMLAIVIVGRIASSFNQNLSNSYSPPLSPDNRAIGEMLKKLHDPMESAGKLPSGSPSPWPSGSVGPREPSSTDNVDAEEKIRKILLSPPPSPKEGSPSSPPFWNDTPNATTGDGASKAPALPAAPLAPAPPPLPPEPARAAPSSPAIPGGPPP